MFIKGMKFGLPFIKKEEVAEEDIDRAEEADVDVDAVADALLTPMGGVVDNQMAKPVNTPLPLLVDEEDTEIAEEADSLLTPMGDAAVNVGHGSVGGNVDNDIALEGIVDEGSKDELKDLFETPTSPEQSPVAEEADKSGDGGKDSFMDGLFDQEEEVEESPVEMLIASLPDIALEEVVNAADEVKALMNEWKQHN